MIVRKIRNGGARAICIRQISLVADWDLINVGINVEAEKRALIIAINIKITVNADWCIRIIKFYQVLV